DRLGVKCPSCPTWSSLEPSRRSQRASVLHRSLIGFPPMAAPGSASWVAGILARDLRALRREVEAYADERDLWRQAPGVVHPGGGGTLTARELMVHLAVHLGYHLGQVDYHRRLVTGDGKTVGAMPPAELSTARKTP